MSRFPAVPLQGSTASHFPFHHYKVDEHGRLTWVDLLIATGQSNLAMNRTIRQIAERYVSGGQPALRDLCNELPVRDTS